MTGLDAHGFRLPAYGGGALADVLPAVVAAAGVTSPDLPRTSLELPDGEHWVVVLVDGLGMQLLQDHPRDAPFLTDVLAAAGSATGGGSGGTVVRTLTAGVPSTTATSLTSLGTGLVPGRHGVVGYTSRVPGTDTLLNALKWDADVDPHDWQPHRTALGLAADAGMHVTVADKREFAGSGLSVAAFRGARRLDADDVDEQVDGALAAHREAGTSPSLTYLYLNDVDHTGHGKGVDSPAWRTALSGVDDTLDRLREELPDHVRLLVTADHGMLDVPVDRRIEVGDLPELSDGVRRLGGEARLRHLYCAEGAAHDVAETWADTLGDRAVVRVREEVADWFGGIDEAVTERIGDVVVAARDDWAVLSAEQFPLETRMVGFHGSLTPVEMDVPLVVC
ncbi:alkaline phosphatase family protein [Nocardioidaceae bacterium]|nr:alkaline phosphatase family protein [Nocardioidaceae bacterium]